MAYRDQLQHVSLPLWFVLNVSRLIMVENSLTPRHAREWIRTSGDVLRPIVKVQPTLDFPALLILASQPCTWFGPATVEHPHKG